MSQNGSSCGGGGGDGGDGDGDGDGRSGSFIFDLGRYDSYKKPGASSPSRSSVGLLSRSYRLFSTPTKSTTLRSMPDEGRDPILHRPSHPSHPSHHHNFQCHVVGTGTFTLSRVFGYVMGGILVGSLLCYVSQQQPPQRQQRENSVDGIMIKTETPSSSIESRHPFQVTIRNDHTDYDHDHNNNNKNKNNDDDSLVGAGDDNDDDDDRRRGGGRSPRLAWLISFPNSGTSYTTKLVRHLSGYSTLTNYGEEWTDPKTGNSVPLLVETSQNHTGPYWIDPIRYGIPPHDHPMYLLTKTHCGGRCERCGPNRYIETTYSFRKKCASGRATFYADDAVKNEDDDDDDMEEEEDELFVEGTFSTSTSTSSGSKGQQNRRGGKKNVYTEYSPDLVRRSVHLFRDPFDNVVSRFHLEKKRGGEDVRSFDVSRDGFRSFCRDYLDVRYAAVDPADVRTSSSRLWDDDLLSMLRDVPCHSDFVRYALFHNMAFAVTNDMGSPTMILYYESYDDALFRDTVRQISDFLQLNSTLEDVKPYVKSSSYRDHFHKSEMRAVRDVMKRLSFRQTWEVIEPYFRDI